MRLRESIQLDAMIEERRLSLASDVSDKKARALVILIETRDKLDELMGPSAIDDSRQARRRRFPPQSTDDFGDIVINVTEPPGSDPLQARAIAKALKQEFRK